jgi:hypothetical protein
MTFNFKKYIPHAIAIALFAIITLIYFKPQFGGKVLSQHDIMQHRGMSKEIMDYRIQNNSEPLWTNSMFGGMPAYQVSTLYPNNYIAKLDAAFKLFIPVPAGYLFLYFLGFFILLLCLEVNVWLSLIGALAYGLSSYFLIILQAGHNSKANALGYLPALLGGVILLFRGRYWLGLSITTLFTAMEVNTNHVQISYYGYILIGFMITGFFVQALKEKQISNFFKAFAFFVLASLIGVLPNAGNLMMTNEYGHYSTRGKSELTINSGGKSNENNKTSGLDRTYATRWSYGIGETFTFLIPDFKGGASAYINSSYPAALKKVDPEFREQVSNSSAYFGDQPGTSGPVYIGAIIIFLAFLGMFIIKNSIKWPLFFVTLLTVALGWGSNFMPLTNIFMDYVPGYNKFRAVSMIMIVAELTIPLLAILALNELIKIKNWEEKISLRFINKQISPKKILIISVSVVGGFCLIGYVMPNLINSFMQTGEEENIVQRAISQGNEEARVRPYVTQMMEQVQIARIEIFKSDALRSLLFILLGAGVIYLFFINKIKKEILFAFLGLFIVIDLWTVDTRYLNEKSFVSKEQNLQKLATKSEADEVILKDTALDYRVLNLNSDIFNDAKTSYYHKSIGGYHGAKLKKYAEIIEFHIDKEIDFFRGNAGKAFASDSLLDDLMGKLNVINMLNTKYFILPGGEDKPEMPLPNKQANGNAWLISNLTSVVSADSEIVGLGKINTKTEAITQEKFKTELQIKNKYSADGEIKLISYQPNNLIYESNSNAEIFAVFSEIYYPKGWNAYVDGQLKPHAEVNYILRGMPLPAGKHKIEFKFEPQTYKTAGSIAFFGSILLLITVGFGLFMNKKNSVIVS